MGHSWSGIMMRWGFETEESIPSLQPIAVEAVWLTCACVNFPAEAMQHVNVMKCKSFGVVRYIWSIRCIDAIGQKVQDCTTSLKSYFMIWMLYLTSAPQPWVASIQKERFDLRCFECAVNLDSVDFACSQARIWHGWRRQSCGSCKHLCNGAVSAEISGAEVMKSERLRLFNALVRALIFFCQRTCSLRTLFLVEVWKWQGMYADTDQHKIVLSVRNGIASQQFRCLWLSPTILSRDLSNRHGVIIFLHGLVPAWYSDLGFVTRSGT